MQIHATPDEVVKAYCALGAESLAAVRNAARILMQGTRYSEPLDLVHDALVLMVDGKRKWPVSVDFTRFMYATMRSMASNHRKRKDAKWVSTSEFDQPETIDWDFSRVHAASVEDDLVAREAGQMVLAAAARARAALAKAEDAVGVAVADSLLAGLEPAEARAQFGLDANAYRAGRKRFVERMRRAYGSRSH